MFDSWKNSLIRYKIIIIKLSRELGKFKTNNNKRIFQIVEYGYWTLNLRPVVIFQNEIFNWRSNWPMRIIYFCWFQVGYMHKSKDILVYGSCSYAISVSEDRKTLAFGLYYGDMCIIIYSFSNVVAYFLFNTRYSHYTL